jgi:hypothetical protein
MSDEEDLPIGERDMRQRLFGNAPPRSPLDLPGVEGRSEFRDLFEHLGPDSAGAFAGPGVPQLPPEQQAIVDALWARFVKWTRNTNFTASEPAHAQPMLWSEPIDLSDTYTLATAADPAGVYHTVLEYTAPSGRWARINAYGYDVDGGFTYDDSILWQITVNGLAVPSMNGFGEHRGTVAIPRQTFIIVPENQTVRFNVQRAVAAGGTNDIVMAMQGWSWRLRKDYEGTKASVAAF